MPASSMMPVVANVVKTIIHHHINEGRKYYRRFAVEDTVTLKTEAVAQCLMSY